MDKPKLLIIDDDPIMLKMYTALLKQDFEITVETNGMHAIEKSLTLHPALVLLDLHMPNVDGFEVLSQFQKQATNCSFPVICSSGDTSGASRQMAYEFGAIGFISKPPDPKFLSQDIQGFLKNINTIYTAKDNRRSFVVAYHEQAKYHLMLNTIKEKIELDHLCILLAWKDGSHLLEKELKEYIDEEKLIYLKIKPSLITRFPYMQDLQTIANYCKRHS